MQDFDKEPLIIENLADRHMYFLIKLQIICGILYTFLIIFSEKTNISINFMIYVYVGSIYMNLEKFKYKSNSKFIFYNDKIDCVSDDYGIVAFLNTKDILHIKTTIGVKYIFDSKKQEDYYKSGIILAIFVYGFIFIMGFSKDPFLFKFLIVFFMIMWIIGRFGIRFYKNINTKTLIIYSSTSEPMQLAFLDKNEQNLLKEYFMKRCKKLISFNWFTISPNLGLYYFSESFGIIIGTPVTPMLWYFVARSSSSLMFFLSTPLTSPFIV